MSLMSDPETLVLVADRAAADALVGALRSRGHRVRTDPAPLGTPQPADLAFVEIGREEKTASSPLQRLGSIGGAGQILVALVHPQCPQAEVAALEAGADEVWTLPLDPRVLGARLEALERRRSALRALTEANRELRERQRLLQTILDAVPHRMFIKDRERRFILVNRAMSEVMGFPPEAFIGRPAQEFSYFTPNRLRSMQEADDRVLNEGLAAETLEESIDRTDGSMRVNRVIKIPVTRESGEVIGVAGISEDITDRMRNEEALRASQRLLQILVDTLPMYVTVKDHNLRYTLVNRLVRESQDPALGELLRHTFEEGGHHSQERQSWVQEADRRVLETGEPQHIPALRTSRRLGVETWESVIKLPLRNESGELVGILTVGEDITERKRAEAERLHLERQFQHAQKLESLGVLAGGIAHDFNNLLTGILGNAELALLQLDPNHPATEQIADVRTAGLRAADLTRQLLDYAGKRSLSTAPVQINTSLREIVQLVRVSIPPNVAVRFAMAPELPTVQADASQIQQVAMNLITNAAEAIGNAPGTLTLATGVETLTPDIQTHWHLDPHVSPGEYVYLEVRDTGSGMTEEVRARIFEPFFTTKFKGRGLGLAAVLGIVRSHRGAVGIHSVSGSGTAFRVWLPITAQASAPVLPRPVSPAPSTFSGQVLLVDDEPLVRNVLCRQLEVLGLSVATASNGQEALDRFGDRLADFSLVVLDATMPVLGGQETLRELKRRCPTLPVILCSGYDEQAATPPDGVFPDGYLKKPVPMASLREMLHRAMPSTPKSDTSLGRITPD